MSCEPPSSDSELDEVFLGLEIPGRMRRFSSRNLSSSESEISYPGVDNIICSGVRRLSLGNRPDRIRGMSCRNLAEDPLDTDSTTVPIDTKNDKNGRAPKEVRRASMTRPDRMRGMSFRHLLEDDDGNLNKDAESTSINIRQVPDQRPKRVRGLSCRYLVADSDDEVKEVLDLVEQDEIIAPKGGRRTSITRPDRMRGMSCRHLSEDSLDCVPEGEVNAGSKNRRASLSRPDRIRGLSVRDLSENPTSCCESSCGESSCSQHLFADDTSWGTLIGDDSHLKEEFIPNRLCPMGGHHQPKQLYKIQANCPNGQVRERRSSIGATISSHRPTLGRVGRQASVRATISVKDTLKKFQS